MGIMLEDKGIVLVDVDTNEFYCGLNTFDKNLRKAQVYHKEKFAQDVIDKYQNRKLTFQNVEIKIV